MKTSINHPDLLRLAVYLGALPVNYEHFDMKKFFEFGDDVADEGVEDQHILSDRYAQIDPIVLLNNCNYINTCGTAACAIGHAPLVPGISVLPREDEEYVDYSFRFLSGEDIPVWEARDNPELKLAWNWCFGEEWAGVDNTPQGAAKRIMYLLSIDVDDLRETFDDDVWFGRYVDLYKDIIVPTTVEVN